MANYCVQNHLMAGRTYVVEWGQPIRGRIHPGTVWLHRAGDCEMVGGSIVGTIRGERMFALADRPAKQFAPSWRGYGSK
jgi:hypothetical protein